jgi:hypothetical protein
MPEPKRPSIRSAWLPTLEAAIRAAGVTLVDAIDRGGADGASTPGHIEVLVALSSADRFCALAHEFAHGLLHQRGDKPTSKAVRETEAEAVAFIVGTAVGVASSVSSRDYVGLYDGNADTLRSSRTRIQQTARTILGSLNL